jgi:hypothetical protein
MAIRIRDNNASVAGLARVRGIGRCNRLEIAMRAMRIFKILAVLLIGLFLSMPHTALAQRLDEANDLNR